MNVLWLFVLAAILGFGLSFRGPRRRRAEESPSGHAWEEHTDCERAHCPICYGGLAVCIRCGCMEGSLAAECPGVKVPVGLQEQIYNGRIDYRDGKWRIVRGNA